VADVSARRRNVEAPTAQRPSNLLAFAISSPIAISSAQNMRRSKEASYEAISTRVVAV